MTIGSQRKPQRRLRSSLNGTWFGYPLHPVFTDVPITAWMLTALFDVIWLISPTHTTWAAYGAFVTVIVGLLGALGSARLMSSLLYGVAPYDPVTFGAVVAVLALVALAACGIPARRAIRIAPATALRS